MSEEIWIILTAAIFLPLGIWVGVTVERIKWNELISDGKIPKPNN